MFGKKEDKQKQQLIEKLQAGIALHEQALHDLQASYNKAWEDLTAYQAGKVFKAKHAMEADLVGKSTMTDQFGSPILPMMGAVFVLETDYTEESLLREKRHLAGEVARISDKLKEQREALAGLDKQS